MNGNWYVLRKGKTFEVHSCVKRGYEVVATRNSKQLAVRAMFAVVGNALCLTTLKV
jgi:hypothetical protein